MDKKLVLFFGVVVLIGILGIVYASQIDGDVQLREGWNLVNGLINPNQLFGDNVFSENIQAIYVYVPDEKKYVRTYPNSENKIIDKYGDSYFEKQVSWVYSDVSGVAEYDYEEPLPIEERPLSEGWNFVGISSDMVIDINAAGPEEEEKYTLNAMKGSCNFERIYHFESVVQEWSSNLVNDDFMDEPLSNDALGLALLIKVSDDCTLGSGGSTESGPPGLPMGEDNSDYIIEENIGIINYLSSSTEEYQCALVDGECTWHRGKYNYNGEVEVIVELDNRLSTNEFVSKSEERHGDSLQKGDFAGNDYYIIIQGDELLIYWKSRDKIVFVQREPYDATLENDYLEDFLVEYLEKYPSDLNWNN